MEEYDFDLTKLAQNFKKLYTILSYVSPVVSNKLKITELHLEINGPSSLSNPLTNNNKI